MIFFCVASLSLLNTNSHCPLLHLIKLASLLAKNGILSFQVLEILVRHFYHFIAHNSLDLL